MFRASPAVLLLPPVLLSATWPGQLNLLCMRTLTMCMPAWCVCAGTGGSLLVIGSAAGVAYMGLEGVGFGYYLRKVTPWVLAGYIAANACYVVLHGLPSGSL